MTANKLIRTMLRLKGLFVSDFQFRFRDKVLDLWVKPHKNGCRCPRCKQRGKIVNKLQGYRVWRDIPICGWSVLLWYSPREIECPKHGRIQEDIPWADAYSRVTYRFESAMLVYCQLMTQKAAARILHISKSTLSDMLHRTITRCNGQAKTDTFFQAAIRKLCCS